MRIVITLGTLILTVTGVNTLLTTGLARIIVGSLALLLALLEAGSPPPLTRAVFKTLTGAFASTEASTVIVETAPLANTPLRLQVIVCPVKPQAQPAPIALIGVRPAGNSSVIKMDEPSVLPEPALLTNTV